MSPAACKSLCCRTVNGQAPDKSKHEFQAATFNVNGRKPAPGLDLQPWLAGGQAADIVAVGFQEIVPLNAGNVMTGRSPSSNDPEWLQVAARSACQSQTCSSRGPFIGQNGAR